MLDFLKRLLERQGIQRIWVPFLRFRFGGGQAIWGRKKRDEASSKETT